MTSKDAFIDKLVNATAKARVLRKERQMRRYCTGIKTGGGAALVVVIPESLVEFWQVLKTCVEYDKIILVQAANTGLTGGSTPDGNDYDRDIVIISTLRLNKLTLLNQGTQVLAFAGATLYELEDKLDGVDRGPHSIIGSSCIGASIVGGICNNSGGNLVNRGPAYTELSLFAQIDAQGQLKLINHLGIELGDAPEEVLGNLERGNFKVSDLPPTDAAASDRDYQQRVRDVSANTPARYNADPRRLHEAAGCAGKLAIFAVRLDTFPKAVKERVFFIGTNDPERLSQLRRDVLSNFKTLPEMGEYMHRGFFDASVRYCKDTFLFIKYFGSAFLPKLFAGKALIDGYLNRLPGLPNNIPDRVLQGIAAILPNHVPPRMRQFRDKFEHYLIIKANDSVIDATRDYLAQHFAHSNEVDYLECDEREAQAALLIRFVAGGAPGRYAIMHGNEIGALLPLDVSLPRNMSDWHEILPQEILDQLHCCYRMSHFLCMVFHWEFITNKGVDAAELKAQILAILDKHGAKYPAEHNVGHLYHAPTELTDFYQKLDPSNSFNPGIGKTSKRKHYAIN